MKQVAAWQSAYPLMTEAWLTLDQSLMRHAYPGFTLTFRDKLLLYRGPLRTNYGSHYDIELRLPERCPEQEPHLWIVAPTLAPDTPHRYAGGRICTHADPFIPWRTMSATMVSVMAGWLFRLERWRQEQCPWDTPIHGPDDELKIQPDGTLYMSRRSIKRPRARPARGPDAH